MSSLFLGNNRQHTPICAETDASQSRKVNIAKEHVSPYSPGIVASTALMAGVSLVSILQAGI